MADYQYNTIGDSEAAAAVLRNKPNFLPWIGAGVSMESRIPGAQEICQGLADQLIERIHLERSKIKNEAPLTAAERQAILDEQFYWQDDAGRYARSCGGSGQGAARAISAPDPSRHL